MDDLTINSRLTIPGRELEIQTSRSGGPGGQHANTADTRVTLRWPIDASLALSDGQKALLRERLGPRLNAGGVLQVHVDATRSQFRNRDIARQRLADLVREALKPRKRRKRTKPSKAQRQKRLDAKRRRSQVKRQRRRPRHDD